MVTTLNKTFFMLGKYDTYKGSTLGLCFSKVNRFSQGKYDTYKGSTQKEFHKTPPSYPGKYDTYKGSTPYIAVKVIWNFLRGI